MRLPRRALLLATVAALATLAGCAGVPAPQSTPLTAPQGGDGSRRAAPPNPDRVTITVSGDLLWHDGLLRDARAAGAKHGVEYDFVPVFEHVRPLIQDADVSVCHVETPIAPKGVKPRGYPTFASPPETIAAARDVGFDYCTTASNHTFDQGFAGATRTLDVLDEHGIVHTGSYRSAEEAKRPAILTTASGVKVAIVAGTYGLNGAGIGASRAWAIDRLDPATMIERGRAARAAGAQIVLAAMHAGTEHRAKPEARQVRTATALANSGVFDLVYGHHAHVPQAWDRINDTWIVYGGGNLVGQMKVATPRAYEQYLARLTFERRGDRFEAADAEYVPLLMTLSRPGEPARVLDVNRALAEGVGDRDRLLQARANVAKAVALLGEDGVSEG